MIVKHVDSLGKIAEYLSKVSLDTITYDDKPFPIFTKFIISNTFFRRFHCPDKCGGCCGRFTLDYFSKEEGPAGKVKREFTINDKSVDVWTYIQKPNDEKSHCDFCEMATGRCTTHDFNPIKGKPNPFSCQMEPIKLVKMKDVVYLSKRPFGRGWAMTKCDGTKGALCKFYEDKIEEDFDWNLRILSQLNDIAKNLKLSTILPATIDYIAKIQKQMLNKEIDSTANFTLWTKEEGFNLVKKPLVKNLF